MGKTSMLRDCAWQLSLPLGLGTFVAVVDTSGEARQGVLTAQPVQKGTDITCSRVR